MNSARNIIRLPFNFIMYGHSMSQPVTTGQFHQMSTDEIGKIYVSKIDDDSDTSS